MENPKSTKITIGIMAISTYNISIERRCENVSKKKKNNRDDKELLLLITTVVGLLKAVIELIVTLLKK